MASPPADYYISSDYDDSADAQQQQLTLNDRVLVAVIVVLFCAIFFLSSLHIYGKRLRRLHSRNSHRQHLQLQNQAHFGPATSMRNAGLSKAAIAVLPTFTYTAPTTNVKENESSLECAVCLSEFRESEKGRILPVCKHSFHTECIDMWFYSHSTCPLCRAPVMPTNATSEWITSALPTSGQQEERGQEEEARPEIRITVDSTSSALLNSDSHVPFAAAAPLWNKHNHRNATETSSQSSEVDPTNVHSEKPSCSTSIKHKIRSVPHITIEIPARQDIRNTSPGCISLPGQRLRCHMSSHDQSCSSHSSVKSPGIPLSLKRIASMPSGKGKSLLESPKHQ